MTPPYAYRPRPAVRALLGPALLGLALLVGGCGFGAPRDDPELARPRFPSPSPAPDQPTAAPDLAGIHDVIATGLHLPWDLDFLPDGSALVTERDSARILRVEPGATGWRVRAVQTIDGVDTNGEGGLLGIAVSPDYESDGWVFAYHSTASDNRIVRFQLGQEPEPIRTGIPRAAVHNGGQLAFGPDGYLYASTGDADRPARARRLDSLGGKVLRLTIDGDPAPGNPGDRPVWASGLRNVQGLAWDRAGRLWATEFGTGDVDELNRIEPGGDYGWPACEGRCPDRRSRLTDPVLTWPTDQASCAGAAAAGATLVLACLRGQRLWLVDLTRGGTVLGAPRPALVREYGRLRAAVLAPDGSVWVTTSNLDQRLDREPDAGDDRIIRLVLSGAGEAGKA